MSKYSLETLQALATSKGIEIDARPSGVIYLIDKTTPVEFPDGSKGFKTIPNPKNGLPNFDTLATVHKFLTKR